MVSKKKIPLPEAIIKIRSYCNYRERCHMEVRDKLYSMNLWKKEVDEVLLQMMDEDLLNEERFARSFARGYFRTKQWGRYKIKNALQQRQIHNRLIDTALTEIDEADYAVTIQKLIVKKLKMLVGERGITRKQKVIDYLLRKGYTYGEIKDSVDRLVTLK